MIPKKTNKLYTQVAEELNIEVALLENFVEFLYKTLRTHLSNLDHPRINVEGLGHFVVKNNLVKKSIQTCQKLLENHDTSTFGGYSKKVRLEEKLDHLIKLQEKIILEEQKKELCKKQKDEYIKSNMEGASQDNGGN